jgi:hypothetical protein
LDIEIAGLPLAFFHEPPKEPFVLLRILAQLEVKNLRQSVFKLL